MIRDFLAGNFLAHTVTFGGFMAGDFMAGNFLAWNFMAHSVTFGDFMAGNFLAGDFLGWIRQKHKGKNGKKQDMNKIVCYD